MGNRLVVVLALMGLLPFTGCDNQQKSRDTLEFLERGQAKGHVTFSMGGSALSAGMKQVFFLGPENASVAFDGNIDFGAPFTRQPFESPDASTNGASPGGPS